MEPGVLSGFSYGDGMSTPTKPRRHIKGLSRFTYWDFQPINPRIRWEGPTSPEDAAHREVSSQFETIARRAPDAIYKYAKADYQAFEAPWVGRQISRWRIAGEKDKIRKLIEAFLGDRGHRLDYVKDIARDQRIFKKIVELRLKGREFEGKSERRTEKTCFEMAGEKCRVSPATAKKIYWEYMPAVRKYFSADPSFKHKQRRVHVGLGCRHR